MIESSASAFMPFNSGAETSRLAMASFSLELAGRAGCRHGGRRPPSEVAVVVVVVVMEAAATAEAATEEVTEEVFVERKEGGGGENCTGEGRAPFP